MKKITKKQPHLIMIPTKYKHYSIKTHSTRSVQFLFTSYGWPCICNSTPHISNNCIPASNIALPRAKYANTIQTLQPCCSINVTFEVCLSQNNSLNGDVASLCTYSNYWGIFGRKYTRFYMNQYIWTWSSIVLTLNANFDLVKGGRSINFLSVTNNHICD